MATDPFTTQKAKAEADLATANAVKAEADAAKARADAELAQAQADAEKSATASQQALAGQKAQAELDKLAADARNAQATAAQTEAAADKAKADARTAAAQAETAEAKAGLPDVPTFPTVSEPTDKSINVQDTGGQGTALYTAAQALEDLGHRIGHDLAWILGVKWKQAPPRYEDPRIQVLPMNVPLPPAAQPEQGEATGSAKNTKVWIMDSMTPAEGGLVLVELRTRLETFQKDLVALTPEPPTERESPLPEPQIEEDLDVGAGAEAGAAAAALGAGPLGVATFAASTAAGLVNFGVELVGALRTKYSLYGRQVSLNRQALLGSAAGVLIDGGLQVGWPKFTAPQSSPLVETFTAACRARDKLEASLPNPEPADESAKKDFEEKKGLIDRFDAYVTSVMATSAAGHSLFLDGALLEAALPPENENTNDVLLYVDISAQGADAVMGYGAAKGSSAAFLGFVQAYFAATKRNGELFWAGTSTAHVSAKLDLNLGTIRRVTEDQAAAG